ncbi:MAG TPA: Fe-S cluster assembly protein SufD [Leptolyngbyaceae cyanobacterium M33_DOE_097]|uniref:Fe-S cluster assembly protein SufD n=1 Tax=Oscillatoriales cyanobacterium SpSt-418 TaxID=2282169 RepID=A0A7C3KFR5_9CYAN|nr:Fe-S cluster assembly protein SufD [Leptolyngbyaceae cyanobacterium M33_DOE_097]
MSIQVSTPPDVAENTITSKVDRAAYLAELINLRSPLAESLSWVQPIREQAVTQLKERSIPSNRDEEWRFTDLATLLKTRFVGLEPGELPDSAAISPFLLAESASSRLVFVDGVYAPDLSDTSGLPDTIKIGSLKDVAVPQHLAQQQGADEVFTLLNTAGVSDGAVVLVPADTVVEAPIHLLFVATGTAETLIQPRVLVVASTGSRVIFVEDFVALGDRAYFTNAVTEVWVEGNAEVGHVRVQREASSAFHIAKTAVSQARDSRYQMTVINLGASLSRHNLEVYQTGEQTDTTLNALTLLGQEQLSDTHSLIAFTKPYGTANQVNKCIVGDRAHAVFNGRIVVPQAAQLTNAAQLSRNLLVSPKARVDTKPQLEITADNVKCAHGATVSQLEEDELFYLQSRGIDATYARTLLTYAFAVEVVNQIEIPSLRDRLVAHLRQLPS